MQWNPVRSWSGAAAGPRGGVSPLGCAQWAESQELENVATWLIVDSVRGVFPFPRARGLRSWDQGPPVFLLLHKTCLKAPPPRAVPGPARPWPAREGRWPGAGQSPPGLVSSVGGAWRRVTRAHVTGAGLGR